MPKAAPILPLISESSISTERSVIRTDKTDSQELVAVALFSGLGLFVSLVAVILGVQGMWF